MSERASRTKTKQLNGKKVLTAVLDKIIGHIPDVAQVMKLRTVNRDFNATCLEVLRTSHFRELVMKFNCSEQGEAVRINDIGLMVSDDETKDQLLPFMRFLRESVDVNPTKLEIKNLHRLDRKFHATVHDAIFHYLIPVDKRLLLTHVTGLEEICQEGCEQCTSLVRQCQVFGPFQRHALQNAFDEPKVFRELIITDRLLIDIAIQALNSSNDRQQLLENVNRLIPQIACDRLVLRYKVLKLPSMSNIPREVLDRILATWKPRTIGLVLHDKNRSLPESEHMFEEGNFTMALANSTPEPNNGVVMFENVKVDFSDAYGYKQKDLFLDVTAIIKNLFPTNHIIFTLIPHRNVCHYLNSFSAFLLGVISERNIRRLDVDVLPQMLHHQRELKLPSSIETNGQIFNLTIENNQEQGRFTENNSSFKVVDFTGSRFIYGNLNHELRMNVWLEKKKFLEMFHESDDYQFAPKRLAFIKNFLDPKHVEKCRKCQRMIREDEKEDPDLLIVHTLLRY